MIKVLGSGSPIVDTLAKIPDSFLEKYVEGEKGGMVMIDDGGAKALLRNLAQEGAQCKNAIGGSAFNTIGALAHLGIKTSFLGKLGKDANGAFLRKAYSAISGDPSSFKETDKGATANCFCLVTPDSQRTMRSDLGAASMLEKGDLAEEDFAGVTHVHIEGYQLFLPGFVPYLIAEAKKHHCTVSFDLASFEVVKIFREEIASFLKEIDILFANEDEANMFLNGTIDQASFDPVKALHTLAESCPLTVVKLGKKGAWVREKGVDTKVEAKVVEAVDTTGAGDLYQAGFLYGILTGKGVAFAGKAGAILGAEVVQILGADIPESSWEKIRAELKGLE